MVEDGGDAIRVEVDAAGEGYLVVADAIQHGWEASVDGTPAPIRRADHALAAVLVPAGEHEVELRYTPPGWYPGLIVSGASLAILLVGGFWRFRRVRGPGASSPPPRLSEPPNATGGSDP